MATGDMNNSIKQLLSELKATKCPQTINIEGFLSGSPQTYLGIYHYIFTSYNSCLNGDISNSNNELFGKSDMRFMEAVYKILRDIFDYKPHINREQFFSPGYAERKVIMATDILRLVRKRYRPPKSKTFRVAAAPRDEPQISPREKVQQEPLERPRKIANKSPPDIAGAIVLRTKSTSSVGEGFKIPKSSMLGQRFSSEDQSLESLSATTKTQKDKSVNVEKTDFDESRGYFTEAEHAFREPAHHRSHHRIDNESPDSFVRHKLLDSVLQPLQKVNEKIGKLEAGLKKLEKNEQPRTVQDLTSLPSIVAGLTKQMSDVVFQLDTLMSRVVLVENRLVMIEDMLNRQENDKDVSRENDNYHGSSKEIPDYTEMMQSNRNNNSISSHLEKRSIKSEDLRNAEDSSIKSVGDFDYEDNIDNMKVSVIREDAQDAKMTHSKMAFIQTLVSENGMHLDNTLNSDVSHLETSVSKDIQKLPLISSSVPKLFDSQYEEMVSPIRSLSSNKFASIQNESMVGLLHETDKGTSKDNRRSSTPSHFMLDTSTLDRVSRISQMMSETKQLLH